METEVGRLLEHYASALAAAYKRETDGCGGFGHCEFCEEVRVGLKYKFASFRHTLAELVQGLISENDERRAERYQLHSFVMNPIGASFWRWEA